MDDEPALRHVIAEAFADEGYRVGAAENGGRALDSLPEARPDVIVVDLMMPVVDGWAFIERYRKVAGGDFPIVGVSAVMTPELAGRLCELGVRVCMCTPFDLAELLECVGRVVGWRRPAT